MKTGNVVLLSVLFLIIGVAIGYWYIKNKSTCYDLPEHGSPDQWGRKYWRAIHSIAEKIPCSICRQDGKSMFVFAHDLVNMKTGKPLWDEDNFYKWVNKVSELKKQQ